MEFNKDQKFRDQIIFGTDLVEFFSGIQRFSDLNLAQLSLLVENNFIDLEDCQNNAPSVGEFLNFMNKHPQVNCHGYAVDLCRDDYRVSIEGLEFEGEVSEELKKEFKKLCEQADECKISDKSLFSWWD